MSIRSLFHFNILGSLYVLKEYANQGNLYSYVHRDRPYGIPEDFKLRVSVAVAHGMQHLASHMVRNGLLQVNCALPHIIENVNGV